MVDGVLGEGEGLQCGQGEGGEGERAGERDRGGGQGAHEVAVTAGKEEVWGRGLRVPGLGQGLRVG